METEDVVFANRQAAGQALAAALMRYQADDPLILGIPRGGVVVAAEVARRLGVELDVAIARKLGTPDEPELAMGAVTADGGLDLDQGIVARHGVTEAQVAAAMARETAEATAREQRFRGERPHPRIADRTVVVVDDGLATGATMRAVLQAVRAQRPRRLVAAIPVGPRETAAELQGMADEVVCLAMPEPFEAVGAAYDDFEPVADETVQQILHAVHPDADRSTTHPSRAATTEPGTT